MILEFVPYNNRRCFMPGGRGVESAALLMFERVINVHARCALGHSDAVRAVPKYPHGRVSSCDMMGSGVVPIRTLASRDCSASSRCVFRLSS